MARDLDNTSVHLAFYFLLFLVLNIYLTASKMIKIEGKGSILLLDNDLQIRQLIVEQKLREILMQLS